jgi:hypothetical protein
MGVLKPLYVAPVDDSAIAAARENGNESGRGAIASDEGAHGAAAARVPAVGLDAWTSALKPRVTSPPPADIAPPDIDAGSVTPADLAAALASGPGDDDDGDALALDRHAPWFAADDLPGALAPPDAPPRRP